MPAQRKLSDKQHKDMIRRYAETGNYSQVAREYGVSVTTVKRHVDGDTETLSIVNHKKEQNTLDMLQYMDCQKPKIQSLLANIIEALNDPVKLQRANVRDLATAYGIIYDKITASAPKTNEELLNKAREILGGVHGVIE